MTQLRHSKCKIKSTLRIQAGLISFFISCHLSYGQDKQLPQIDSWIASASSIRLQNFPGADSIYNLGSELITRVGIDKHPTAWISILHQRAFTAIYHSKIASLRQYIADSYSAIDQYKVNLGGRVDSLKAQTQLIEANYFYIVGNYTNALANLDNAETFFRQLEQNISACNSLYQVLQYQASIFYLQGEYESCIDRYLASIRYFNCFWDHRFFPNYILIYRNIAQAYAKMGDMKNAVYYYSRGKANLDSCQALSNDISIPTHGMLLYNSLGDFYRTQGKIDSAKYFLTKALPFLYGNAVYASRVNGALAKVALAEKDYNTGLALLTKSLQQITGARGQKHYMTASTYRSISSLYQERKDYKNSLFFIQNALNSLSSSQDIDLNDYTKNPSLDLLTMPKEMVMTLNQKATLLYAYYQKNKTRDILFAARNTNLLATQLLDSTRNEFSLEKDKVVLGEDAVKVYQTGLYLASVLYQQTNDPKYLSECFDLMDRSKSAVLMDHIKLIKSFSGIPTELQTRERELKVELSAAEQQLYDAEIKKEETSSHRQHFGEIKKDYTTLLHDIKLAAPNYYKLRIENVTPGFSETQNMLSDEETLVEYFLADTVLYSMVVTHHKATLFSTPIDSVRENVESLRQLLTTPAMFATPLYQEKWNQRTKYLFDKLIAPWQETLYSSKRIVIIPHDVLNYLPFEMLTSNTAESVLLNSAAISYASSASLLREQKHMTPTGNFFAGFNADYSNQTTLPHLAGAVSEVNSIKNIFGFRSSQFSAATADEFRREAAHYKIIHLALHSLINDEKPMFSRLVFTQTPAEKNADITANELYSMELNAEIAVLSACETGLGKLHRGEGMMSLSRAFMYAGVPSTVISLWKVPDQSASILMKKFYQLLNDGNRKDDALRLAKLEFVKENPEMSHPFFWAGFIVNGKTDPITISYFSKRELAIIATTLALILLIIAMTLFRKKRKTIVTV